MSQPKKQTISRRDFLKVTSVMAGSALLSACTGIFEIAPTPTFTPSATFTHTSIPTQTLEPTDTSTPEPSPTPKPKPWTLELRGNDQISELVLPHKILEDGRDVFDFRTLEALPLIPDIKQLKYWHEALRKVTLSDGSNLVKPFPDDVAIPDWNLESPKHLRAFQSITAKFDRSSKDIIPVRVISGFRWKVPVSGSDLVFLGITIQVYHPDSQTRDILLTGMGDPNDLIKRSEGIMTGSLYPAPRLGIPDDIAAGGTNVSENWINYTAFYLTSRGVFDIAQYKKAMLDWHTNNFPPDYFTFNPYIEMLASL